MTNSSEIEGWVSVYRTSTDYEADMVRDRLDSSGIPAVVFTQRDHAFNLNVGTLATVNVMVPPDRAEEATRIIEGESFSDEELDDAATAAGPGDQDRRATDEESLLDSGNEELHLSRPEEEEDEDEERT